MISENTILEEKLFVWKNYNPDPLKYERVFEYFWETGNIGMKRKMIKILNGED